MELTSLATPATSGALMFMELNYFIILYMFVEWLVLLHDCYTLWAGHMWRFISSTQNIDCASTPTAAAQAHNTTEVFHVDNGDKKSLEVEIKMVLGKVGMFCDHDDKRLVIASEILGLFDEDEPSLDEVKEAFSAFDRNKDGYIDSKELQYALSEMGHIHISEVNCRLMIDRYDFDRDDKISFLEFLKLMEDCF